MFLNKTVKATDLLESGASLMSVDGENPEYDRAIVEIVCTALGVSTDERDDMEAMLRIIQRQQ